MQDISDTLSNSPMKHELSFIISSVNIPIKTVVVKVGCLRTTVDEEKIFDADNLIIDKILVSRWAFYFRMVLKKVCFRKSYADRIDLG